MNTTYRKSGLINFAFTLICVAKPFCSVTVNVQATLAYVIKRLISEGNITSLFLNFTGEGKCFKIHFSIQVCPSCYQPCLLATAA